MKWEYKYFRNHWYPETFQHQLDEIGKQGWEVIFIGEMKNGWPLDIVCKKPVVEVKLSDLSDEIRNELT